MLSTGVQLGTASLFAFLFQSVLEHFFKDELEYFWTAVHGV